MSPIEDISPVDRQEGYLLQWTEKARIQLIEAVIEVEEQMIARASTARWSTTGKRMVTTRFENKWSAVATLLPIEYRGKIWNDKKQMYYKYKCDRMFNSLLHAYRERVAGKSTQAARWGMSEQVLKLLQKREDLVRQWCSEPAASSLRLEISTSVNASEDQKGKLALLVDTYAKETDRNHIDQEETVEKCNKGCLLRRASEDRSHQGKRVRFSPRFPSRSLSESSDQGNMLQTRLRAQARAQTMKKGSEFFSKAIR